MQTRDLNREWHEAQGQPIRKFSEIPDGEYTATICNIEFKEGTQGNAERDLPPIITYSLEIVGGDQDGRYVRKVQYLSGKPNLVALRNDLVTLECKVPANLEHIYESVKEATGKCLAIKVKMNGAYQNIYFNRLVNVVPASMAHGGASRSAACDNLESDSRSNGGGEFSSRFDDDEIPF